MKALAIKLARFKKSFVHPYKDTDTIQFDGADEHVKVDLSADGAWVALYMTDRNKKETAKMIPAQTALEYLEVDPAELRAWLAAQIEPERRGPGRPPKVAT